MAKEKNEISNRFWSFFGDRNLHKFLPILPHRPNCPGFSLIEVLVVIAILGILAGGLIALINPIAQLQKARDSERRADLKKIQTALELYRSDAGNYPDSSIFSFGTTFSSGGVTYMQNVPDDSKTGVNYIYSYNNPTGGYTLYACAENTKSKGAVSGSEVSCTSGYYFKEVSP